MAPSSGTESVFTYGAPQLKFGAGSSEEIAYDLTALDVRRVLVVTDPGVAATGPPQRITEQIRAAGIDAALFDRARVEPTDVSMDEAVAFARDTGPWDAFVAVGGTLEQQRLLTMAPREASADDLSGILHRSLELW